MTAFDFLQWVLSDFWRFVGCVILVGAVGSSMAGVALGIRGRRDE